MFYGITPYLIERIVFVALVGVNNNLQLPVLISAENVPSDGPV
jgi:hypothetical protein